MKLPLKQPNEGPLKTPDSTSEPSKKGASTGLLTTQQLAPLLGKSERTVEAWRAKKLLPFVKIGRSVLFDWEVVRNHLNRHFTVNAR